MDQPRQVKMKQPAMMVHARRSAVCVSLHERGSHELAIQSPLSSQVLLKCDVGKLLSPLGITARPQVRMPIHGRPPVQHAGGCTPGSKRSGDDWPSARASVYMFNKRPLVAASRVHKGLCREKACRTGRNAPPPLPPINKSDVPRGRGNHPSWRGKHWFSRRTHRDPRSGRFARAGQLLPRPW
jgi:hypothetical protein